MVSQTNLQVYDKMAATVLVADKAHEKVARNILIRKAKYITLHS